MSARKRLTAVLAMVAVLALSASATSAQKVAVGFKGGLNVTNWYGDDWHDGGDTDPKMGVCIGGFTNISIASFLSIQPEVLFSMKGWKKDVAGIKTSAATNYIDVPILVKLNVPLKGKFRPFLFAGPLVSVYVNGNVKMEFDSNIEERDLEDEYGPVKSTEFGALCGAGFDFDMGSGKLMVDCRYDLGLTNFPDTEVETMIRNEVYSLTVGFGVGF